MIKHASFTDDAADPSLIIVTLSGEGERFRVMLSSHTDDDMNVTYRFHSIDAAKQCYKEECERLIKIGLRMQREVNYGKQ